MTEGNQPPEPVDPPPWGKALVREYRLLCEQWKGLNELVIGLPPAAREKTEAEKLKVYERMAVVRAQAVNEFLTLLRWAKEDAPGQLEIILQAIDVTGLLDQLRPGVERITDERVDVDLEPVREAYKDLRAKLDKPTKAMARR